MKDIHFFGNDDLLNRHKKAFLCSHKSPDSIFNPLMLWIASLNPENDCVVCGCLSGIERFVIRQCAERGISLIIVFAEYLPVRIEDAAKRLPDAKLSSLMGQGKLLIASVNNDKEETEASARNAELRNRWMLNISQEKVIGYAQSGGRLEMQLIGIKDIKYILPQELITLPKDEQFKRGWALYTYLSNYILNIPSYEIRAKLLAYLRLELPAPSPLHSAILFFVTKEYQHIGKDFNFPKFFEMWGISNLRQEDWERHKSKRGTYYQSIAEKALHLLEIAPPEFQRSDLIRLLAAEALKHYPRNNHYITLAKAPI